MSNKTGRRRALANLYHACMWDVLRPISSYGETGLDVTHGLRVLHEQLFLMLLLTTCRASEYTLDLESCLGTLRQS
jgi:hypothetical protein